MLLKIHGLMAILVAIDFALKKWAANALQGKGTITLIEGLLGLTYVENRGAAFGMLSGKQTLLILLSVGIIILLEYYLIKEKPKNKLAQLTIALVVAGGVGNLIDRAFQGFVIDYIDINQLFSFPMFNFADICVTIGEALLIFLLFYGEYKERKEKKLSSADEKTDSTDGKEE